MRRTSLTGANSSTDDRIFDLQQGEFKRLNLLGIQLRPLYISGFLPPSSIAKSPCKSFLYNIFTTVSLLSLVTHIVSEIRAIYEHRNKMEMVTALTFQITLFIHTTTLTSFFVFHRKQLARLLESLEVQFVSLIEKVWSPTRHGPIIRESSKQASILTWSLLTVWWVVFFAWGVLPITVRYFDILTSNEQKTEESLDPRNEYLKYFGLILWLPPNIDKFPIYELVYTFNFLATYAVSCCCTAAHVVFFIFMYNISTHFKILTACIESIDEIFPQKMETTNVYSIEKESLNLTSTSNAHSTDNKTFLPVLTEGVVSSGIKGVKHESGRNQLTDVQGALSDEDGDKHMTNSTLSVSEGTKNTLLSKTSDKITSADYNMHRYLIDCIQYHQALLR
jgi:hypothetical protein